MKKFTSLLLTAVLLTAMLSVFVLPASAEAQTGANAGEYIECHFDETSKTVVYNAKKIPADAIKIEGSYNSITLEAGKWYVVSGTATAAAITVNGTKDSPTNLILKNGCTLTVNGTVAVVESHFLNIYGQKGNAGVLSATSDNGAGIGGLLRFSDKNCGNITIHGGTVNAVSNAMQVAGIGGAGSSSNGGVVTIYGGLVNAIGNSQGPCIGIGGYYGGNITVYGGLVNATSNDMPAIAGSLHLPDSAIIMSGNDKDSAVMVETYRDGLYVQIHFHNAEAMKGISETKHGCAVCGYECRCVWDAATGKCSACGFACTHEGGFTNEKCNICLMQCTHDNCTCNNCGKQIVPGEESDSPLSGSILSGGSLTIVLCVVCLAVGFLVAMFIFKKKKPAVAGGEKE